MVGRLLTHAAMGFAAGEVLAGAIAAAGTIDRETVRKELSVLDMATVVGCYGVDTNGRPVAPTAAHHPMAGWKEEGSFARAHVQWPNSSTGRSSTDEHPKQN